MPLLNFITVIDSLCLAISRINMGAEILLASASACHIAHRATHIICNTTLSNPSSTKDVELESLFLATRLMRANHISSIL